MYLPRFNMSLLFLLVSFTPEKANFIPTGTTHFIQPITIFNSTKVTFYCFLQSVVVFCLLILAMFL